MSILAFSQVILGLTCKAVEPDGSWALLTEPQTELICTTPQALFYGSICLGQIRELFFKERFSHVSHVINLLVLSVNKSIPA